MKLRFHNLLRATAEFIVLLVMIASMGGDLHGQTKPDSDVLATVFGNHFLAGNSSTIRQEAAQLQLNDRYQLLADFVLPSESHSSLRLAVEYSPLRSDASTAEADHDPGTTKRVQFGGKIESSMLDLVDVAKQLDRLTELRSRIESAVGSDTLEDKIARLSGLVVVNCAANDFDSAAKQLADLYEIVSARQELHKNSEAALLLAILVGTNHSATQAAANDLAHDLRQTQLDLVKPSEWRPFHRHLAALTHKTSNPVSGDASEQEAKLTSSQKTATTFEQWHNGSLHTAKSRGTGCPQNIWSHDADGVRKTSGHNIDLLYFQSPLHGDFEFECDASEFSYRSIHPTYAGHWAGAESTRTRRRIGTLAELNSSLIPLPSPMTKFRHEIHYRLSVHDQQLSIYGNGRLLHSVPIHEDRDPWLALRRTAKHTAHAWNVRITGQPEIPDELRLSNCPDLTGWISYFGNAIGNTNSTWTQADSGSDGGLITGEYQPDLPHGSHAERLLYYHRPMLEDGSIEYDFFYLKDESLVHPAMDRTAFILGSNGISIHKITDGVFDRSELLPGNLHTEPDNRRGEGQLPIRNNQWNKIRLELTGDQVDLFLNEVHVYRRRLEPGNQRNFGLFHYADRSHAVVRNVVWRGDWPKELPALADQELAGNDIIALNQSANELADTFRHSFKSEQFPFGKFAVTSGSMTDTRPEAEGLYVQRQGSGRYERTLLSTQLAVSGDFDITASFDSLVTRPCENGHSSLAVSILLNDDKATQTNYRRRHNRHSGGREDQHLAYADVASFPEEGTRRSSIGYRPAESESGILRVARRGNRLYTLFAEGNSQSFRITGTSEFPKEDVQLGGIHLSGMTFKESFVSFRWKELVIRAEQITGPAVDATDPGVILADLGKRQNKLPVVDHFDFTKNEPADDALYRWGEVLPWDKTAGGLTMRHKGRERWSATGITPYNEIDGDFDITATFDLQRILNPEAGERSTIYVKSIFGTDRATQASLMFDTDTQNVRQIYARLGTQRPQGGHDYRVAGSKAVSKVSVMRIARYGTTMYFLARESVDSPEQLIAMAEVSDKPVRSRSVNFMVHSGGEGRETHALLKSLKIRAEKYTPVITPNLFGVRPPANPEPESKGFIDRVLDFFK